MCVSCVLCRLLCLDPDIIGTPFFVYDFVEGKLFKDSRLPDAGQSVIHNSLLSTSHKHSRPILAQEALESDVKCTTPWLQPWGCKPNCVLAPLAIACYFCFPWRSLHSVDTDCCGMSDFGKGEGFLARFVLHFVSLCVPSHAKIVSRLRRRKFQDWWALLQQYVS